MELLRRNILTAVVYATIGVTSAAVSGSVQYALPLWIPAGFATAALISWGFRVLPGLVLGTFAVNFINLSRGHDFASIVRPVVGALGITVGAVACAIVGTLLARRITRRDPSLSHIRNALIFVLAIGPLAALISGSIGPLMLVAIGNLPADQFATSAFTWWGGDALGIILITPLALAILGSTHGDWTRRKRTIIGPLLLVTIIIILINGIAVNSEHQRMESRFSAMSRSVTDGISNNFTRYTTLMQAAERFYTASGTPTEASFATFARQPIADTPGVRALAFAPYVTHAQRAAFERSQGDHMPRGILQRSPGGLLVRAARRDHYTPITYIEPIDENGGAIGFDLMSNPLRARALHESVDAAAPRATEGIQLVQGPRGVLVMTPLYAHPTTPTSVAQRREQLRGFMSGAIELPKLIGRSTHIDTSSMSVIARDLDAAPANRLLHVESATPYRFDRSEAADVAASRFNANAPFTSITTLNIAGRTWQFEFVPTENYLAGSYSSVDLALLITGLLIGITTSTFMLFISGYTVDTEHEVERRLAELRVSETRTASIIEHAQDAFVTINRHGIVSEWNPQAEQTFGWTRAEALGQMLGSLIVPKHLQAAHQQGIESYDPTRESAVTGRRIELPAVHRDGHEFPIELTITPVVTAGELELHAFMHDITDRQIVEQERQHAAELKTHFVAMASHEMRTPLTSIIGYAQTLLDRWSSLGEQDKLNFLEIIVDQGERFGELIEDLLMITQIEDGKLRPRPEHTNIQDVAQRALRDINITASIDCDEHLHAWISNHHLLQILVNYIKNAQKYGKPEFSFRAYPTDGMVTIEVADHGDGVDPSFVPHLFERFSQADYRETGKVRGVGLGLSIVQALAHTYDGEAGYRPNTPHGSIFYVTLPQSSEDAESA